MLYQKEFMKMKGTPYAWFADNRVKDRVNRIAKKLGVSKKKLPEKLKEFGYQDIRDWSNMEAKWELATLLAHPKSSITNIFGGSLHTIQSVGINAYRKARNIKFLKRINPEWNSIEDAEKWVIEKGVLPEFLIHELGLHKEFQAKNVSDFLKEFSTKLQSKDYLRKGELKSLQTKYKLSNHITNLASKFMSIPERMLRRDAFLAHYIKAWERFGGAIKDPNHPFLIEMGKKGVKATQFLYNAPNRPMFARSALGKVMSRFQLFSWNAVRFRNDIMRQAKMMGYTGEAGERFARTLQMDLFVFALGSMFMYSLFDNALPQPWSWFQDSANWLFGDEKERNKAFYGQLPVQIAPLQMIMPPISRIPVSALQQWVRDDYSKFTDYVVWTAFPFGRLAKDVVHPKTGWNPSRFMVKFTGIPMQDLGKKGRERKKAIEEGTYYSTPKPGFKF
jgi:hypothetical protein